MSTVTKLHPTAMAGLPVLVVAAVMLALVGVCIGFPCFATGIRYGLWVDECPATDLRLDVDVEVASALRGRVDGRLFVRPSARWLTATGPEAQMRTGALNRGFSVGLELRGGSGEPVEGAELGPLEAWPGGRTATLALPDLPDDDYTLHLTVDAGFESTEIDVELPLFAPALVHLMTDRPLYRPGQEVLLRSVVLDRRDRTPIANRPGRWRIFDPSGAEVMVERDRADGWGIADSSFPLEARAAMGTWSATWETGDASDRVEFDVRPFQLPRLTVTARPSAPWYRIGDTVVIEGTATTSAGAPVRRAVAEVQLSTSGGPWPLPLDWEGPRQTRTGQDGRFRVVFGEVPADLMARTELRALVTVTDDTGEAASGVARGVLSHEGLHVQAVTELGDGLVANFNNRAYLRVSTPDDVAVAGATVSVRNPFDPMDDGTQAVTDEDGVLALQIDPGDPVTVVEPAPPVRIRPFLPDPPQVEQAAEARTGAPLGLDDRRALDALHPAIEACGRFAIGNTQVGVAVQLSATGAVRHAVGPDDRLGQCVVAAMQRARFGRAGPRVLSIRWVVPDSRQPWLSWTHGVAWGADPVSAQLEDASLRARRCLSRGEGNHGSEAFVVQWYVRQGATELDLTVRRGDATGLSRSTMACLQAYLSPLKLAEPAVAAALGESAATLMLPQRPGQAIPQPTTRTAYQLQLTARRDGAELGRGTVILPPGQIPPVRLRATPSLALPGDQVLVEVFRGPGFLGNLPERLFLMEGTVQVAEATLERNAATLTIPEAVDGFLQVDWAGARTVIHVGRPDPLAVHVSTDAAAYRPGANARLTVRTTAGNAPRSAAVGLVGVDATLAQLAPLVGPDAYGRVTVRAEADPPAFGAFDPQALALGQIRGDNAARAALLRVSWLPQDAAGDHAVSAVAEVRADTDDALVRSFYRALEATMKRVRTWEETAPRAEQLDPPRLIAMYDDVLVELRTAGTPAVDGFGRVLSLEVLPADLLEQLEPRQLVSDGTRLPEDLVSLSRYVHEGVRR